jgi:hypothetical protein
MKLPVVLLMVPFEAVKVRLVEVAVTPMVLDKYFQKRSATESKSVALKLSSTVLVGNGE